MAIADITNVNPYSVDRRANIQAAQSAGAAIGAGLESFGEIYEKAEKRRKDDEDRKFLNEERHRDLLNREKKSETETFGEFNQATAKTGAIGVQFQTLAADDKSAFVELSTELQNSKTSKERRSEIREQMGQIGNRAKNIAGALNKLNENASSWDSIRTEKGISDATPPATRDFMMDLINRENEDGYQVILDEETGKEKFIGETSNGYPIDFFVEDVANGTNTFRAIPKVDKNEVLDNILSEVPVKVKQIENAYGLAQENDSELMGKEAAKVIMGRLDNEEQFRSLASGYGFGYEELQGLEEVGIPLDPNLSEEEAAEIDKDGDGFINNQDELKGYLANRMLHDLSDRLPQGFKQVNTSKYSHDLNQRTADAKQAKAEQTAKDTAQNKAQGVVAQVGKLRQIGQSGDISYLQQFKGQKTGAGAIIDVQQDPDQQGSVAINTGSSSSPKWLKFDLTNQSDVKALQSTLSGGSPEDIDQAYGTTDERVNSFLIQ